jgi:hypothetical protein
MRHPATPSTAARLKAVEGQMFDFFMRILCQPGKAAGKTLGRFTGYKGAAPRIRSGRLATSP